MSISGRSHFPRRALRVDVVSERADAGRARKSIAHWRGLLLACLLTPLLVLLGVAPASADINVEETKQAVVWVDTVWEGSVAVTYSDNTTRKFAADYIGLCSGWIVSKDGHVVTAGHCVRPSRNTEVGLIADVIEDQKLVGADGAQLDPYKLDWAVAIDPSPTVKIGQPSSVKGRVFEDGITAQLLDSQDFEAGDNALVQVANFDTSEAVLPVAATAPQVRDEVTSVGFPQDTASITEVDRQDPTFKDGRISSRIVSKKGVPQLQLDGELIGGMSGGPTLNADGAAVGVNSAGFTDTNQSYVTDTNTLRTFLSRNSVALTEGTAAETSAPTDSTAPVPGEQDNTTTEDSSFSLMTALLAILILAVVVTAVLLLRRRKPPTQPPSGGPQGHPPYGGHQSVPQGQPPYGSQQGQPPYAVHQGQPPYAGQPGQPPYAGHQGQPPYAGQPGQPPYAGQLGQPPYGGQPQGQQPQQ
jgi:serine protease Do